jgi:hypothetical protein
VVHHEHKIYLVLSRFRQSSASRNSYDTDNDSLAYLSTRVKPARSAISNDIKLRVIVLSCTKLPPVSNLCLLLEVCMLQ